MTHTQKDEASFLRDVANHEMTILLDQGEYRHIRFKRPGSSAYYFDLLTYPGGLSIRGDMGSNTFERITDMFEFFRTDDRRSAYYEAKGITIPINPGYWSEKLTAVEVRSRHKGGVTEFDSDDFKRVVNEYRVSWVRENRDTLTKEQRRELWEQVQDEIIDLIEGDSEDLNFARVSEFRAHIGGETFYFQDFFEHRCERYTHSFIWHCLAITWGIRLYDQKKAAAAELAGTEKATSKEGGGA